MKEQLLQKFAEIFGDKGDIITYFAPGRVNLIGEHTDYNGGHVFPCALTIGTYAVVRKRDDRALHFYSMNFIELGKIESSLDNLSKVKEHDWANYVKGVIWAFEQKGYKIENGFDILIYGNIPNGSGLSSSASLEVLTGYILKDMYNIEVDMINIALLSQMAENKFVGVNCGIMDQFAIAMGKADQAIFLDTSNLSYEYAPIELENVKIVIANSNKKRGLGDSKYNERRAECERALEKLKTVVDIKELGNLTEEEFEKHKYVIENEIEQKRAKHAVYENQRTIKAVQALKKNNIEEFGKLMISSHNSLKDDYEVTGLELDTLVEAALKQEGVIGSRMTGAGFGGCTVSLVYEEYVEKFIEEVGNLYAENTIYKADFYVVDVGNGPSRL
jgi:galactokinase